MRLGSILAHAGLALFAASSASAALNVSVSSPVNTLNLGLGQTFRIDVELTTTGPEALALGLRVADYGRELSFRSATHRTSIFDFSLSVPFGGVPNTLPAPIEDGVGPGNSVNLFQGVALTPAASAGPETISVWFRVVGAGEGVINVGAFAAYLDEVQNHIITFSCRTI